MRGKQSQYNADHFAKQIQTKYTEEQIDPKRIKRVEMLNQSYNKQPRNTQQNQNRAKAPVKFHKFREDAKKLHRQLTQQNHDFMKMTQIITKSVLDNQRYKMTDVGKNNKNKDAGLLDLNKRQNQEKPNLILNYEIEMNSALIQNQVNAKQVLEMYPYKKLSLEVEPNNLLNPDFQFFFFRTDNAKSEQLQNCLKIQNQGLLSDLKDQVAYQTYYLDYFDYVQFCKFLFSKPKPAIEQPTAKFPPQVLQLAKNALTMQNSSDEQQDFNQKELQVETDNSCHRIFECDETELTKPFDSMYFPFLRDFEDYRKYRAIQWKNLKIEAQDIVINTDVRNIITSEKIYLINIIEEMQLSVELLKTNRQQYLINNLHEMMIKKIIQYLHLVCSYTKSTILMRFNITDPQKKIYQFLRKSILYDKEYENLDKKIIQKYPVLEIWYYLPDKIFGYAKEEIHSVLYKLIEATLQFEKNMKYLEQYDRLKIKQYNRQYLPDETQKKGITKKPIDDGKAKISNIEKKGSNIDGSSYEAAGGLGKNIPTRDRSRDNKKMEAKRSPMKSTSRGGFINYPINTFKDSKAKVDSNLNRKSNL